MILDIYTDGGSDAIKNSVNIRIGAVVVDQSDPDYKEFNFSKKNTIHELKLELGFNKDDVFNSNSTIAEFYCVNEILREIILTKINIDKINIYTDSNSVFNIYNKVQKARCKMIKRISESVDSLVLKMNSDVNIMWIKGHSGVWGNVRADKLCKRTNESVNEIPNFLPKR